MATADTEASTASAGWLGRTWQKIATVLAVIGLIDLSNQLLHWAELIHWIAMKYAIVREWLFGWLPFHISPEWHDPIVLFLILLSVTKVGVNRETRGRSFLQALNDTKFSKNALSVNDLKFPNVFWYTLEMLIMVFLLAIWVYAILNVGNYLHEIVYAIVGTNAGVFVTILFGFFDFILFIIFFVVSMVALVYLFVNILVAARWLLLTAVMFGALVLVNQSYVLWLEPLATQ